MRRTLLILTIAVSLLSCSDKKIEKKGFQVREIIEDDKGEKVVGLQIDSLQLETRPRNVLLTSKPAHRLIPIYKVNYDKKTGNPFTGSNYYHTTWEYDYAEGNNWNNNFMPGFSAVYGYNFINVSHFNNKTNTQNEFFEKPVLIKTLYYPSFSKDTLNFSPVKRNYYMVSVYDEDTNNDGYISVKDLRRFYLFDMNGEQVKPLVPKNYSVMSSEYDSANDFMYVFAKTDQNNNGQMEQEEETHIFWINLKHPDSSGLQYKSK